MPRHQSLSKTTHDQNIENLNVIAYRDSNEVKVQQKMKSAAKQVVSIAQLKHDIINNSSICERLV